MKQKNILISLILTLFTGAFSVFAEVAATNTTVTEFLPNLETVDTAQTSQIMEMFRGLIPNATINAFSGNNPSSQAVTTVVSSGVFTKTLKFGDTDPEVLLLQKALNEDFDTVVSTSGVGSSGNETNYFGQKTKLAVIKLQNKHYGEVLAPNGLSVGTGVFGPSTRAMMNNMQKNKSKTSVQTVSEEVTTIIPSGPIGGQGETVKILSLEPTHGKDGTLVTIHGEGMTVTANKIIAGSETVYNAASSDGKTLVFTMKSPVSFSFPGMSVASSTYRKEHFNEIKKKSFPVLKYPVCVKNDTGMSNCVLFIIDT